VGRAAALRRKTVQPPLPVQHPVVPRHDRAGQRAQLRARQTAQVRRPAGVHVPDGPGPVQPGRPSAVLRRRGRQRKQEADRQQQQQTSHVARRPPENRNRNELHQLNEL